MSTKDVELALTRDEALVFFDWLTRFNLADGAVDHQAERRVLWDLESALESQLTAPLSERYPQLLAAARDRIQGRAGDALPRGGAASPTDAAVQDLIEFEERGRVPDLRGEVSALLPLPVTGVATNSSMINMYGAQWALAVNCDWVLTRHDRVLATWETDDDPMLAVIEGLRGRSIVTVEIDEVSSIRSSTSTTARS